jgi:hypothetical protein
MKGCLAHRLNYLCGSFAVKPVFYRLNFFHTRTGDMWLILIQIIKPEAQPLKLSLCRILMDFPLPYPLTLSQVSRVCLALHFGRIDSGKANVDDLLKNVKPEGSPRAGSDTGYQDADEFNDPAGQINSLG